jgi:hypothetical protein
MRRILIGTVVVAAFFGGTLWALDLFFGDSPPGKRPALAEPPPLKPVSRMSTIIAPIAIANNAIRDVMEAQAPRNLTGKRDNPLTELLGKADIGWTMNRGPLAVAGRTDGMAIATTINGELRATGQIGEQAGQLTSQLGSMIGGSLGRQVGQLAGKPFDQKLAINGNVTVVAKPALQPNWRIEPNLTANVALADRAMNISGIKLNVMQEVKPLLDRTVNEQMAKLQTQLRNDPTLEQTARREWVKLCRSISLGPAGPNMPALWLEVKPTQAVAAQPKIDPNWLIVTGGVQAETRITPAETKPNCPFPATIVDLHGGPVQAIAVREPIGVGTHAFVWDGRDESGRRTPAGVYFARAMARGIEPGAPSGQSCGAISAAHSQMAMLSAIRTPGTISSAGKRALGEIAPKLGFPPISGRECSTSSNSISP